MTLLMVLLMMSTPQLEIEYDDSLEVVEFDSMTVDSLWMWGSPLGFFDLDSVSISQSFVIGNELIMGDNCVIRISQDTIFLEGIVLMWNGEPVMLIPLENEAFR